MIFIRSLNSQLIRLCSKPMGWHLSSLAQNLYGLFQVKPKDSKKKPQICTARPTLERKPQNALVLFLELLFSGSASAIVIATKTMEEVEKESIREASKELSKEFKTLINEDQLVSLTQLQHLILGRLQDSNAVLSHFNDYSEHCFAEVSGDLARNTRLLKSMKADLDYIFQKLRSMKAKILATYPDAFPDGSTQLTQVPDRRPDLEMP